MKSKKSILKIIACSLVLSLSLTMLQPLSVFAEQNFSSSQTTLEKWVPSEEDMRLPNTEGDLTLEQLETAKLLPEDTPEIVSQESIEENSHVNRLWEQEQDLNTIIFQNRDGTKTAYHYSDPVKYTDKNGKVKDKKNKLSETTNGEYTNAENDINAYFPKKIHKNKGVELKFGEYVFEMSPNINGSSGASRQTGHDKDSNPTEYVEYPEVFADDISLRYTPTFGGYKEDIILNTNVGINRFEFKLTTNGLSLVQASTGNYYLAEPLTGEYVTALGNVIVYDNTGVESEGYNHYYEVTTLSQDEQYLITVIVDEQYLESKDTAYPVYVDPTLTVMPQGDVEDAVLYSNDSETAYSGLIKIGYDAAYGTGRGLYDFPILNFTNDFILMYGNQIKSAELNLYAQIQGSDRDNAKNLSLYEFHSDWSPSTVKWNNTNPNNYSTLVSSKSVTTGWTAFNILPVIEKFKSDSDYTMAFKGLLLKANSETYTTWKKFVSSYGTSSRRPYITITYNDSPTACSQVVSGATYYLKNYNGDYLDVYNGNTLDNTRLLTYAFHGNANQQFKITNISGGEYEIAPQHTAGKVLSVNSSGQVVIEEDCNLSRQRWYIFYRNGSYHIVNKLYNTGVMETTYDSDYVNVGSSYDYCCWELERTHANGENVPNNVGLIKYNNEWYFDYTDDIQEMLDRNVQTCFEKSLLTSGEYVAIVVAGTVIFQNPVTGAVLGTASYATYQASTVYWFFNQVNHNSPWDIKREKRWEEQLPSLPYLNQEPFYFDGDVMTAEDLGNYTFAYWGRAIKFGNDMLQWGAGVAQVRNDQYSHLSTFPGYAAAMIDSDTFISPYGDMPNDVIAINKGIQAFESDYPNYDVVLNFHPDYGTNLFNEIYDMFNS